MTTHPILIYNIQLMQSPNNQNPYYLDVQVVPPKFKTLEGTEDCYNKPIIVDAFYNNNKETYPNWYSTLLISMKHKGRNPRRNISFKTCNFIKILNNHSMKNKDKHRKKKINYTLNNWSYETIIYPYKCFKLIMSAINIPHATDSNIWSFFVDTCTIAINPIQMDQINNVICFVKCITVFKKQLSNRFPKPILMMIIKLAIDFTPLFIVRQFKEETDELCKINIDGNINSDIKLLDRICYYVKK